MSDLLPIKKTTSTVVLRWQPGAWLRVSGADAATFLQGQFTNDVRGAAAGEAVYGLWLTVKGKVLADSFVLRGGAGAATNDVFWVGSYFSEAAVIRERLESFIIADDVVVEDRTAEVVGLSVIGPDAGARLRSAAAGTGWVFRGRRTREEGFEWVGPRAEVDRVRERLGEAEEWDAASAEARRIATGIPAVPMDLGPGDLPNEAGLEAEAISYTKGCYLGQEVMARLKSMGRVRRRLLRVAIEAPERPAVPAALWVEGKQVGELRSVARALDGNGFVGLAMVSLLNVAAESKLALAVDGAPSVTLLEAP